MTRNSRPRESRVTRLDRLRQARRARPLEMVDDDRGTPPPSRVPDTGSACARRTISSASANVVGSATVGPDPITLGSSATGPWTSEIASVRLRPAAAPSRPPLIAGQVLPHAVQSVDRHAGAHQHLRGRQLVVERRAPAPAPPAAPTRRPTAARPAPRSRPVGGPARAPAGRPRRSRRSDPDARREPLEPRGSGRPAPRFGPATIPSTTCGPARVANAAAIGQRRLAGGDDDDRQAGDRRRARRAPTAASSRAAEQSRSARRARMRCESCAKSGRGSGSVKLRWDRASRTGRSPR